MTWSITEILGLKRSDQHDLTLDKRDYSSELLLTARNMTRIMYDYLSKRDLQDTICMVNVFSSVLRKEATRGSDFDLLVVWNREPEDLWEEIVEELATHNILPADNRHRAGRFNTQHILKEDLEAELAVNEGRGGWLQRAAESNLRLWDECKGRGASDQS